MDRSSKKALAEQQTVVFVDATGFYLLPAVGRTYAPMGKPPLLRETLTRDHRSLIGALTLDGRVFVHGQDQSLCSTEVVRVFKHVLRHIVGKVRIVWDGASIHYGAVTELLQSGATNRITLVRLPRYAPELNPAEKVWSTMKRSLANHCLRTGLDLLAAVKNRLKRQQYRSGLLDGYLTGTGLSPPAPARP